MDTHLSWMAANSGWKLNNLSEEASNMQHLMALVPM
jgi:hypothetical protein